MFRFYPNLSLDNLTLLPPRSGPMIAMQYRFDFPAGTDMTPIHGRVVEKGPAFDGLAGLAQKAFLVADADTGRINRYAPFYLWHSADAMQAFLLSDAFAAVCAAFGRPEVTAATVLRHRVWNATRPPRYATQVTAAFTPAALSGQRDEHPLAAIPCRRALHSGVVVIDPQRWTLTRLLLWHRPPLAEADTDLYHVPYLAGCR